jgi:DNA adenine methylase
LKWAGGKRQILAQLIKRLPPDIKDRTYHEPFLGAGSLFFALQPQNAFLSDANEHLIMAFEYVRDAPDLVARYLREHAKRDTERYYYEVRDIYNSSGPSAAQAARFIYLNKTCYNGIFRVNSQDLFNVPYGRHDNASLPDGKHLRMVSSAIRGKNLFVSSFEKVANNVKKGDFIYLDPPYPPLNGTSCFTSYTIGKFPNNRQEKLAEVIRELAANGCLFMLSNADTPRIRNLYDKFTLVRLPVTRFITCKRIRHKVQELVVTNYEVE